MVSERMFSAGEHHLLNCGQPLIAIAIVALQIKYGIVGKYFPQSREMALVNQVTVKGYQFVNG